MLFKNSPAFGEADLQVAPARGQPVQLPPPPNQNSGYATASVQITSLDFFIEKNECD